MACNYAISAAAKLNMIRIAFVTARLSNEITCCCRRRQWKLANALTITRIGNRIPAVLSTRSFIFRSRMHNRGHQVKNKLNHNKRYWWMLIINLTKNKANEYSPLSPIMRGRVWRRTRSAMNCSMIQSQWRIFIRQEIQETTSTIGFWCQKLTIMAIVRQHKVLLLVLIGK